MCIATARGKSLRLVRSGSLILLFRFSPALKKCRSVESKLLSVGLRHCRSNRPKKPRGVRQRTSYYSSDALA